MLSVLYTTASRFNRYMVECESDFIPFLYIKQLVLIDTWWNVNTRSRYTLKYSYNVLIDTWWNVNKVVRFEISAGRFVLIDTWWNVNNGGFGTSHTSDKF